MNSAQFPHCVHNNRQQPPRQVSNVNFLSLFHINQFNSVHAQEYVMRRRRITRTDSVPFKGALGWDEISHAMRIDASPE